MNIERKTKSVKLLLNTFKDLNAFSIIELVEKFKDDMNKTTVYRILNRLEESGLLHSFSDRDGIKRYAKGNQDSVSIKDSVPHSHFLCNTCGISSCLPIKIPVPSIQNLKIDSSDHLLVGEGENCHA